MDVETDDFTVPLPSDVITEILIRLPVRSILRFRCVCKSWYALFSDPIFVEKHLKASTENKDYANHRLITSSYFPMDVKSCPIPSVLHEEYCDVHSLDYPGRSSDARVWIVGSVNGLVFIIVNKVGLFLWNPATKESKRLPQNGFKVGSDRDHNTAYGFGYDESSSDYKVVVIKTDFRRNTSLKVQGKIYGLKSNSWRKIGNFHECDLLGDSGKFVSGALHWPAFIGTDLNINESILTFNLSEETFSEISLPYVGERFLDLIGVLAGCLCVYDFDETKVDVWVMKEYGKIESWSKMFSVTLQPDPEGFYHSAPLFLSRENEVLLMIGVDLVLYNIESETISLFLIRDLCRITEINTYIETLVSPYHERYQVVDRMQKKMMI